MLAIDTMILILLGVVVLAVVIGLVIFGGQQPGGDIAKQAFVRSCCQLNSQIVCDNPSAANCKVPDSMKSIFGEGTQPLASVADKIGISGEASLKKFCGCG